MGKNNTNTSSEALLLKTLRNEKTSRPPFWFMRQAGRVLPSYMAIRETHSLWQMMSTPELAAEITLLPVHDLDVDAAILFSDILMVPYAMGMGLEFTETGPVFRSPLIKYEIPSQHLKPEISKLQFVFDTISNIQKLKSPEIPLIGFCGAPLTVLCYMLEGLSRNSEFPSAIKFIYSNKQETKKLIDAVTEVTIEYVKRQIEQGIDVFQLFESHAGLLPNSLYFELFYPSIKRIAQEVKDKNIPFIYFPKGIGLGIKNITPELCDFVSIDWQIPLLEARNMVHQEVGLQGNLDPRVLYVSPKDMECYLTPYLEFGKKNYNWIFNLGHGFIHDTPFENARFMAQWVKNAQWNR
jgi:uroporphyrinogen decarboxylase